jgi:hypothetical protein
MLYLRQNHHAPVDVSSPSARRSVCKLAVLTFGCRAIQFQAGMLYLGQKNHIPVAV